MAKSKKRKSGAASLIVMIVGFAVGILIGRGLEFDNDDE